MLHLSISLLGPVTVTIDQAPVESFRTKSVEALLIYLVCEAKRPHQRETLMALLWPGMPTESAQANMRQTLYRLRKLIPEVTAKAGQSAVPFLNTTRQTIQVNPDAAYYLDVAVFEQSDPAQAIDLYRGDFLAEFFLPDSEPFEEWAASRRAEYRRQALEMLADQTAVHIQQANYDHAIHLARRQLEIDNLQEVGHRQLMEAWARNGRRQEALSHYTHLHQLLKDELSIEPEPATVALIKSIRAGNLSGESQSRRLASIEVEDEPERPKHNLPQRLTSFIGRQKEIAAITDLVRHNRLVMLTGAGGIGKTNLCLQVGQGLLDTFTDGVWLVELAPITDPALVAKTVANTLGLRETSERTTVTLNVGLGEGRNHSLIETLMDYLAEKNCLIILDNCEHVINAAAQFVETLLQGSAGVKVLASSREALGVPGEIPYRVPPLSIPDASNLTSYREWTKFDALHLFVERATAVSPEFTVTEENYASVVKICQRLDGIPLALELAAARVRVLSTAQIATRLDDRFRLLTGGSRTALPRQQTLRALIDWSWELLTEAEQLLLQRLSVFAGGMCLEAVEAVCAGDGLDPYDLLDDLDELVNKSLVLAVREEGQEMRYQLLETIRQYAQERLLAAGQGASFRERHLSYFMTFAEAGGPALTGPDQVIWFKSLERELDNVRAALSWARETDPEAGLRLITAVWRFWELGFIREGEMWMRQLLDQAHDLPKALEAKTLQVLGLFNYMVFNKKASWQYFSQSLALYESLDSEKDVINVRRYQSLFYGLKGSRDDLLELLPRFRKPGYELYLAETLGWLAYYEAEQNNYEAAVNYLRECQDLFREMGHWSGLADTLENFALYAIWQGNDEAARQPLEESFALQKKLGNRNTFGSLHRLGRLYARLGEYPKAVEYLKKSLDITLQSGAVATSYWTIVELGHVFVDMGAFEEAWAYLSKSLHKFNEVNNEDGTAYTLEGFARMAANQEKSVRAIRLLAHSDKLRQKNHNPRPLSEQAIVDESITAILSVLDQAAYETAYADGQAMTRKEAVDYTLAG